MVSSALKFLAASELLRVDTPIENYIGWLITIDPAHGTHNAQEPTSVADCNRLQALSHSSLDGFDYLPAQVFRIGSHAHMVAVIQ